MSFTASPYQIHVKQRSCADVDYPCERNAELVQWALFISQYSEPDPPPPPFYLSIPRYYLVGYGEEVPLFVAELRVRLRYDLHACRHVVVPSQAGNSIQPHETVGIIVKFVGCFVRFIVFSFSDPNPQKFASLRFSEFEERQNRAKNLGV
jgi:hypothetical protein